MADAPPGPVHRYRTLLTTYLGPQRRRVGVLAALLLTSIGLQVANPLVLRSYIDRAAAREPLAGLLTAAAIFLTVAVVLQVVRIVATYFAENVGWIATNALRTDLARHCLALDMSFHQERGPGELIERVDGDVTELANFFSQSLLVVLGNALLTVGILVALLLTDWRIGLVLAAYVVIAVVVLSQVRGIATRVWARARQASALQFGFLEERLVALEDIRPLGAGGHVLDRLAGLGADLLDAQRAARLRTNLVFIALHSTYVLAYGGGLALGAFLYVDHVATIGTVYLVVAYVAALYVPIDELRAQIQDLQAAAASVERVTGVLAVVPSVRDGRGARPAPGPLAIEFDGVSFAYGPDRPTVLDDLTFAVPAGRVLGLLGRTGSGKTTITRLVWRLHDPTRGAVRLGGVDVRDMRLADLRGWVGVVTQDVQLFHGTVRDNLTLFDTGVSDAAIRSAIEQLGLETWYRGLSNGLDTMLDSRAAGLSAGEAQLLSLTRILLARPRLVVLDEPASRLDPGTETLLESALSALLRDRTGIIVAHRLSTVERVDDIMVLEGGRVREHGPRAALSADPSSAFARLLRVGLEEVAG